MEKSDRLLYIPSENDNFNSRLSRHINNFFELRFYFFFYWTLSWKFYSFKCEPNMFVIYVKETPTLLKLFSVF